MAERTDEQNEQRCAFRAPAELLERLDTYVSEQRAKRALGTISRSDAVRYFVERGLAEAARTR
jgi:hypothetical protein